MSYTRTSPSERVRRGLGLTVLVVVIAATLSLADIALAHASSDPPGPSRVEAPMAPPQQNEGDRDPEANLPYLFAVFFITWAAFFAYVFVMSRRQREMLREIEALKRALADREAETVQPEPGPESPA